MLFTFRRLARPYPHAREGYSVRLLAVCLTLLTLCAGLLAQTTPASSSSSSSSASRRLEYFDSAMVDRDLNPCSDFFQYSCGKWVKANPIPSDQPGWGTFNSLGLWNIAAVRETLEQAAEAANRNPVEKQVGDYFAACVDESAVNRAGLAPLQPMLDRIANL